MLLHFIVDGIIRGSSSSKRGVNIGTFMGSTAVKNQTCLPFSLLIPLAIWRSALIIAIPGYKRGPRGKANSQRFFFFFILVDQVFVCRRHCVVGKLLCNALTFVCALSQADCWALATTHLRRLFVHVYIWLDGPWHHHLKRRQHQEDAVAARTMGPNKWAFWTLPLGTVWRSFLLCKMLPEGWQKNIAKTSKTVKQFPMVEQLSGP